MNILESHIHQLNQSLDNVFAPSDTLDSYNDKYKSRYCLSTKTGEAEFLDVYLRGEDNDQEVVIDFGGLVIQALRFDLYVSLNLFSVLDHSDDILHKIQKSRP